jgi:hypothetical protein
VDDDRFSDAWSHTVALKPTPLHATFRLYNGTYVQGRAGTRKSIKGGSVAGFSDAHHLSIS